MYPIFWVFLLNNKHHKKVVRLKVNTAKFILFLQGVFPKTIKKTKQLNDGPYVICVNHASYVDILVMYATFNHHRFLFIGKKELLTWPIINIFFKKIDIAIDRNKPRAAIKALKRAKGQLKNNWSIAIFPEGGIPISAPKMAKFKNGAFKIAIETQTPILPVTFIDNWRIFCAEPILTSPARPGVSRVIIHDPISTNGMTQKDLVYLRQQTFDTINKPLIEYYKNVIKWGLPKSIIIFYFSCL